MLEYQKVLHTGRTVFIQAEGTKTAGDSSYGNNIPQGSYHSPDEAEITTLEVFDEHGEPLELTPEEYEEVNYSVAVRLLESEE